MIQKKYRMILKVEKYFLNGLGFKLCVAFLLSEVDVNSKAEDVQRLCLCFELYHVKLFEAPSIFTYCSGLCE